MQALQPAALFDLFALSHAMTPRPRPLTFAAMMIRSQRRHEERMAQAPAPGGPTMEPVPAHLLALRRAAERRTA